MSINDEIGALGVMFGIAVTGGGLSGIADLFTRPGCSQFIHEVRVPYGREAFLRLAPGAGRFVSGEAALRLALGMRGVLPHGPKTPIAVGITAKLTTGPGEREGRAHVAHLAAVSPAGTVVESLALSMGTRAEQEAQLGAYIQQFLLRVAKGAARQTAKDAKEITDVPARHGQL